MTDRTKILHLGEMQDETTRLQARVKMLEEALKGMMDREARIALQGNEHKPMWEASPEWLAAYNALAASIPADPVIKDGSQQPENPNDR